MNGERLKFLLKYNEMTIETLAEKLKVKPYLVLRWCNGVSEPEITQIKEIAKFFNVSVDFLLGLSAYKKLNLS